jgi:valyl-tRNA synthetase
MNNTTKTVLKYVLESILKLMHPYMPFVTEEIYNKLGNSDSIMIQDYPKYKNDFNFRDTSEVDYLIELIKEVRKVKLDHNLGKDFSLDIGDFKHKKIVEKMLKIDLSNINYDTSLDIFSIK